MKFLLVCTMVMLPCLGVAQNDGAGQKIGHADWEYIFRQLPEYKTIQKDLESFELQLNQQLQLKKQELEKRYDEYTKLPSTTPEAIRKDKESQLSYLQENLQKFQQEAQLSIQKKQQSLIEPVLAKVGKAIRTVAAENGYTYIINPQMMGGNDVLLFTDERYNISQLVLQRLGVTVQAESKPVLR